ARLIQQFLLLARSDPEVLQDQRVADVDLVALSRSVTLEFVPAARQKSMDLSFETAAPAATVRGNEMLLREALANLIDNAIVHGRAEGSVAVQILQDAATIVEVVDDGPGIPEHERAKVFERFYRGQGSEAAGSGLGLAIVRDI